MRVSDLGEFGLINLVQQWTGAAYPLAAPACQLAVPNGDDAAAATFPDAGVTEFYTTDTMVDGIHFTARTTPWPDLGWKAIASNLSDVAAMGGDPALALITLGLPPATLVADVEALYSGMTAICREFGARIAGGDLVRSPVAFITVALTGIASGPPLLRTAAAPGHQIALTGPVGGSAGGLRLLLENPRAPGPPERKPAERELAEGKLAELELIKQHRRPRPHLAAGKTLVAAGVRSAMDVSDGLADDLSKLCSASGVAATLWEAAVPAAPALKTVFPDAWLDLALYGGEDYVLLFTAPPDVMAAALPQLPAGAAVIGEIVPGAPGAVTRLDAAGGARPRSGAGWDHFGD